MLPDHEIRRLSTEQGMIYPYVDDKISNLNGKNVPSFGQSSFGYDIRLGNDILVPKRNTRIDPVGVSEWVKTTVKDSVYLLNPGEFVLAHTVETFRMPKDVMGVVVGKSTYARCGIMTPMTPLEPGWFGVLTLEIGNITKNPVALYIGAGIAQVMFLRGDVPNNGYVALGGKYQGTVGAVPSGDYVVKVAEQ